MTTTTPAPLQGNALRDRLLRLDWHGRLRRSAAQAPRLPPEVVAELGRRVYLLDVRPAAALTGPLGHIPGVVPIALEALAEVWQRYGDAAPVVLVCDDGSRSELAARFLETLGMSLVAAMEGGMVRWRALGYATSRDPAVHARSLACAGPCAGDPEPHVGALGAEHVHAHLGEVGAVRWIKLAAFLLHGKHACVDGRDDHGVIGTPGGSAGELVLALAAWEQSVGAELDDIAVEALLAAYIDTFGRFYLHTDIAAANGAIASMRTDPRLATAIPVMTRAEDWRAYLAAPPRELREAILDHFVLPVALGCGHLRRMVQHPELYGVRVGLVVAVLRAFHRLRWAGHHGLEYVVLGGGHEEAAVLVVQTREEPWPLGAVPLVSPSVDGRQVFVYHPQVAAWLRTQVLRWLLGARDLLPTVPTDTVGLERRLEALAARGLEATLAALADGLPRFVARFERDGEVEVEAL